MAGTELETTLKQLVTELRTAAASLRESVGLLYRADQESSLESEEIPALGNASSVYLHQRRADRNDG